MKTAESYEIVAALGNASRVVVLSHYNPDADAYGSSCGIATALRLRGAEVVLVNESGLIPRYLVIPGVETVQSQLPQWEPDAVVICDCGDIKRVGDSLVGAVEKYSNIINIDHHISNAKFGRLNYLRSNASSTAELVWELLAASSWPINSDIATALYAGILADTGCFRYPSTTATTLEVASQLVRLGASPALLGDALFGNLSVTCFRLQSEVLSKLSFHGDGTIAEMVVTAETMAKYAARSDDTEGLVERARDIEGVRVSFLMREDADYWKVSLRSKNDLDDVSNVATKFGGGGHRRAAAFRSKRTFSELRADLLAVLEELVRSNNIS